MVSRATAAMRIASVAWGSAWLASCVVGSYDVVERDGSGGTGGTSAAAGSSANDTGGASTAAGSPTNDTGGASAAAGSPTDGGGGAWEGGAGGAWQGGAGGSMPGSDLPRCVYVEAYPEYGSDTIDDILDNAEDCYVLVDPFANRAAREAIDYLHAEDNIVGCYMSVGTCDEWQDDNEQMLDYCLPDVCDDLQFVDYVDDGLVYLMYDRISQMANWGCDMVEFGYMDWVHDDSWRADCGFSVSVDDGVAYYQDLCEYVQSAGMGCMAKNTAEGAEDFDGITFESDPVDFDWWQEDELLSFLDSGRLGVVVHEADEGADEEATCSDSFDYYRSVYGLDVSFICEDDTLEAYEHYN